ncbi:cupin domain-containing protein [Streptomyces sp. NRRL S-350]|uniref:cupin domain-containing protein n=1 Tax=Streptomyces sp. NRRL S-350 TaxID=1463902 RepID=UPI00131B0AED|nr:cupin domain-containing protein [Streptomyces sp. NRRL S-350]
MSAHLDRAPVSDTRVDEHITMRRLKEGTATDPSVIMLLEFAPGTQFGEDRHTVREIVHVLKGEFSDGTNVWPAGTLLCAEPGSVHYPQSAAGCTILVVYPDGEDA